MAQYLECMLLPRFISQSYAIWPNHRSLHQRRAPWPCLAAVDRRLPAPLGGEAAHCDVGVFVEAQEVAYDAPVQESAVGVGVREVRGFQVFVSELVEDGLSRAQQIIREGTEV